QVKLVPREETFRSSGFGRPGTETKVTYYDVPHHGPIVPRITGSNIEPLGGEELSIRYTGYESAPLLRAIYSVNVAKNVDECVSALQKDFSYGGQNWVLADDSGNIAWTQAIRVPRRPKGTKPWKVLPGDGSAEWDGYFDPKVAPNAKNPAKGYLVTANADPVGLTADNDPANEPEVGGFPLYMGADYDPGTRVGRITTRIKEGLEGGKKLDANAMSSIQADAVTNWGKAWKPAFVAAVTDLSAELATPGSRAELAPLLAAAPANVKAFLAEAKTLAEGWSYDTPAGTEAAATPKEISDSRATAIMAAFATALAQAALSDEAGVLGVKLGRAPTLKLLAALLSAPNTLKTKEALFDDVNTPGVETRSFTLAKAALQALGAVFTAQGADPAKWRWGTVHTLEPQFFLPLPSLAQRKVGRHGGDGTVDVAGHGIEDDDYSYASGASIRFVAELDPVKGPIARNVIPGGQVFDPASPHFSDLYDLYVKNQTVDLAFSVNDVVARAKVEAEKNKIGRRRFVP
ncbi:MAG TPA: penicillin acylase family protein, partial [Polyangiaceae bacterium]|nr:penicillin acylase family protein [Polyangiaceae bacterium]